MVTCREACCACGTVATQLLGLQVASSASFAAKTANDLGMLPNVPSGIGARWAAPLPLCTCCGQRQRESRRWSERIKLAGSLLACQEKTGPFSTCSTSGCSSLHCKGTW